MHTYLASSLGMFQIDGIHNGIRHRLDADAKSEEETCHDRADISVFTVAGRRRRASTLRSVDGEFRGEHQTHVPLERDADFAKVDQKFL